MSAGRQRATANKAHPSAGTTCYSCRPPQNRGRRLRQEQQQPVRLRLRLAFSQDLPLCVSAGSCAPSMYCFWSKKSIMDRVMYLNVSTIFMLKRSIYQVFGFVLGRLVIVLWIYRSFSLIFMYIIISTELFCHLSVNSLNLGFGVLVFIINL